MEFLLGLSKEETKRRIARQRRLRRWFWVLGILVMSIQVVAIAFFPRQDRKAPPELARDEVVQELDALQPAPTSVAMVTATATAIPPSLTPTSPPAPVAAARATTAATATAPISPTVSLVTGRSAVETASPSLHLTLPPQQVSEQVFALAGSGPAEDTVSVLYRNSLIARTEIDQDGNWQVDVPTAPLDRGENTLYVLSNSASEPRSWTFTFAPWWLDAPPRPQGTLGEGYACAPTVLGMAMDYYNVQDPTYSAPKTTEIVQALKRQGFISGYGADARMLVNLAVAYGYSHSFFYREWTQAHLRSMLDDETPVIANVRFDMSADGYGHSVLVIGMSPDGKRVMVNDPVQGMVEHSWAEFDRSWGSFGPPYRHGTVVKP